MTNLSNKTNTLMTSDRYPPQGFRINSGAVVKIKKAVSRPSSIVLKAIEDDTQLPLLLNGLYNISVTPAKSSLRDVKVTITQQGLLSSLHCVATDLGTISFFDRICIGPREEE